MASYMPVFLALMFTCHVRAASVRSEALAPNPAAHLEKLPVVEVAVISEGTNGITTTDLKSKKLAMLANFSTTPPELLHSRASAVPPSIQTADAFSSRAPAPQADSRPAALLASPPHEVVVNHILSEIKASRVDSPLNAAVSIPARPQNIVLRPPARQVEEFPQPPTRAIPGAVNFPYDRLSTAQDRLDENRLRGSWDDMYKGCGYAKNCFGYPQSCEDTESCRALVTVRVVNGTFTFQMRATDAKYVAVGLGPSKRMYAASVVECVAEKDTINAYMSWNVADRLANERLPRQFQSAIDLINGRVMDGGLYCEVTRVNKTNMYGSSFHLDTQEFNLLIAAGDIDASGNLEYHANQRLGSSTARLLSSYGSFSPSSAWPLRLHGALMVVAWMFAATVGTMAARYYKAAWGKTTLCGKALWFAWHRLLMLFTTGLHAVAIITVIAYVGGWSQSAGLHGILGAVTSGLAFLQGFGGLLRPGPDHAHRPVFNWLHRGAGFLTHCLAVITIFLSVALVSSGLPSFVYYFLAGWVIFYISMHGLHSLSEIKSYYFLVLVFGAAIFSIATLVLVVVAPEAY